LRQCRRHGGGGGRKCPGSARALAEAFQDKVSESGEVFASGTEFFLGIKERRHMAIKEKNVGDKNNKT
jgi:hypothetical protein